VLTAKGRFREALDALVYEPSKFEKFLKPDDVQLLGEDKFFQDAARKVDEQLSSVFGPAIGLGMAQVFLEAGDAANLGQALEQTQGKLKSQQAMEHIFVRTRACWHAMKGDLAGVEADLGRARQLTDEKPASRSAKYEYHLASGRCRFLLGQFETAIAELEAAVRLALHPMEKHTSQYWLARAHQAARRPSAAGLFQAVIADGFATWMETDSRARVAS
jgi:ATP/maltotriose-dependent transcriptional regulator MalT